MAEGAFLIELPAKFDRLAQLRRKYTMLKIRDFPCRKTLLAIAFAGCAGLSLVSLPARADNLQDSQRFLKQGQYLKSPKHSAKAR